MNEEKEIFEQLDLFSMIKDILKQWWVILLLSASVALLANVYVSETYSPKYTVNTTFVVTTKGLNSSVYNNLSSTISLTEQFKKVLDFNLMKSIVKDDLEIDSFDATTNVSVVENTNMMRMSVTSSSAVLSYRITKSILRNYQQVSDYVMSNVILEVMEQPSIPAGPSNAPNLWRVMQKAFLGTAAALIAILAVFSYLKDTVKNEADVKRKIDTRLLGTIYKEKKKRMIKAKNRAMIITNPLISYRFLEAYRMTAAKLVNRMKRHDAKVVLITSVTENEGKSTVAANIALCLAQEGKKVILIDCDFRKPALYKIFGAKEEEILDLPLILKSNAFPKSFIYHRKDSGLFTILNDKQSFILEDIMNTGAFDKIMKACRKSMDYIVLDTSPVALVSDTEQIAAHADASVVVISQDRILAKDINDTIDALNNTNAKVMGCVFNNVSRVGSILQGG